MDKHLVQFGIDSCSWSWVNGENTQADIPLSDLLPLISHLHSFTIPSTYSTKLQRVNGVWYGSTKHRWSNGKEPFRTSVVSLSRNRSLMVTC
jgi:hypothetical protein